MVLYLLQALLNIRDYKRAAIFCLIAAATQESLSKIQANEDSVRI